MKKIDKILIIISMICIVSSSFLLAFALTNERQNAEKAVSDVISNKFSSDVGKISAGLKLEVRDKNKQLKSSYCNGDDLIVNNFRTILKGIFKEHSGSLTENQLVDSGGTSRTYNLKIASLTPGNTAFWGTDQSTRGGYISIGTGTTAAAATDYTVQTEVESKTAVSTPTYSNGVITFSAAIVVTADRNVTETGFYLKGGFLSQNYYHLCFHDVFSSVPTSNGDTCTVTYNLNLTSTGFTNNFGNILAAAFANTVVDQAPVTATVTDTANSSQTINVVGKVASWWLDTDTAVPSCGIWVGTNNAAPARTQYALGAAVGSLTSNSEPTTSSTTVAMASNIVMASEQTITEAGYFIISKNTDGTDKTVMYWRTTFAAVVVPAAGTITVTFTLTCS